LKVNIFFRSRQEQTHSIEELFLGLIPFLSKEADVVTTEVPRFGANPKVIIQNLKFAFANRGQINHVTGDIHYLVLVLRNSILTIHDVRSALKGPVYKRLYIKIFWFWLPALIVKRITVISHFTKSELEQIIPFAKHKIRVIQNPLQPLLKSTPYTFNTEIPRLLFIGTKPNKNLERSLEAIKELSVKVTIIGKLSYSQLHLLKQLRIDYVNKFNLSYQEIKTSYEKCDLVCFASTYEGFGMPIIEAQAIGRPVITSNIGAMAEVSKDSVCYVNPYEVASIKKGILEVCQNEGYRKKLINSGFENIKRFQPDQIAKQYTDLYKEILK
jgi:glycosyltransferase involved in cell wall biosynthesis